MGYSEKCINKLLHNFFIEKCDLQELTQAISENEELVFILLSKYMYENKNILSNNPMKVIQLIQLLYKDTNVDINNKSSLIKQFIHKTSAYSTMGIFIKDEMLSDELKNLYMFDIVEKIYFSKLQKESLRDTSTYNRHIAKTLTEIRDSVIVLFELQSTNEELISVLEKYYEFNRYVNTPKCWIEFYTLTTYVPFQEFINSKKQELDILYKRGNLIFEALNKNVDISSI